MATCAFDEEGVVGGGEEKTSGVRVVRVFDVLDIGHGLHELGDPELGIALDFADGGVGMDVVVWGLVNTTSVFASLDPAVWRRSGGGGVVCGRRFGS